MDQRASLETSVLLASLDSRASRVHREASEQLESLDKKDLPDLPDCLEIQAAEELMVSLGHGESLVTRAALVQEVGLVILDRTDLEDFLDSKELPG